MQRLRDEVNNGPATQECHVQLQFARPLNLFFNRSQLKLERLSKRSRNLENKHKDNRIMTFKT